MSQVHTPWTEEQENWLREHITNYEYHQLVSEFNKHFNMSRTYDSIVTRCIKVLKLKRNCMGGQFKAGNSKSKTYDLGDEVFRGRYWWVKTDNLYFEGRTTYEQLKKNWTVKQRYVYEQAFGKLPDNKIVVFLNKDNNDFDLKNLYPIDRKINVVMNKNRWFTENRVLTLAAIKWCELYYALRDEINLCI